MIWQYLKLAVVCRKIATF